MAKSRETFTKKEKEQKRFKRQQDKKQKMEERKAGKKKGGSPGEMLAYLDENGNLSDLPPDPAKIKSINQEDIQISVPKKEFMPDVFRNGTVSFFNKSKGFGFINDISSDERLFFHIKDLLMPVEEQDKVQFQVEKGPRGLQAVRVSKLG